jgi:hypothetical protein
MPSEERITGLEQMKEQAVKVIEIPGWEPGQTIWVRARRISLLTMVATGQIPNELLAIASKHLKGELAEIGSLGPDEMAKNAALMHEVAKATLVEPTYNEIVEQVAPLTPMQIQVLWVYALAGMATVRPFRSESGSHGESGDSSEVLGGSTE